MKYNLKNRPKTLKLCQACSNNRKYFEEFERELREGEVCFEHPIFGKCITVKEILGE